VAQYTQGARGTAHRTGHALLVGGEAMLLLVVALVVLTAAVALAIVVGPIVVGLALLVLIPLVARGLFR
jgi:uncharacterized membrane protein YjgN (DUF898 family)